MRERLAYIDALASQQRDLITLAQVREAGASAAYAYENVQRLRWKRIHDGVWRIGHAPPDWRTRLLAACLASGPGARASHRSAAALWGLDGAREDAVEITVPHHRSPNLRGVVIHRSVRDLPTEVKNVDGIPVTSVAQTLVELGASAPRIAVERGVEDAINRGLVSPTYLARKLARLGGPGWRGSGVLRAVLSERLDGGPAGSYLEIYAAHVLHDHGLRGWERQIPVVTAAGNRFRIDIGRRDLMLALEFNGKRGHSTVREKARDAWRKNQLEALGWTVPVFSYNDVVHDTGNFVSRVRQLIPGHAAVSAL